MNKKTALHMVAKEIFERSAKPPEPLTIELTREEYERIRQDATNPESPLYEIARCLLNMPEDTTTAPGPTSHAGSPSSPACEG